MNQNIKIFTASDGAEIKYVDEGCGTPILYVYGMGSSLASAAAFIDTMKSHCRFLVFDQRGFGLTEGVGEVGIHQSARDAKALLEHLGLEKVILFGYSMGSAVVFSFLRQFGCVGLEKVIIGDMSPKLINEGDWQLGLYQGHYTRAMYEHDLEELKSDYERFALILTEQLLFKNTPEQPRDFSGTAKEIRMRILSRNPAPLIAQSLFDGMVDLPEKHRLLNYHYWETMAGADFRDVLPTISIPAAILYADPGSGYSTDTAKYMQAQIPDSVLLPVHDCSHMAAAEDPAQFTQHLKNGMATMPASYASILAGTFLLMALQFKYLKGHVISDYTTGFLNSIKMIGIV